MLDVLVVGGGYVGLSVAVAIKQAAPHLNLRAALGGHVRHERFERLERLLVLARPPAALAHTLIRLDTHINEAAV